MDVGAFAGLGNEADFSWIGILSLPLSARFQSWFRKPNLHIWLPTLTLRLRTLPSIRDQSYIQATVGSVDRIRNVPQPTNLPVAPSSFSQFSGAAGKSRAEGVIEGACKTGEKRQSPNIPKSPRPRTRPNRHPPNEDLQRTMGRSQSLIRPRHVSIRPRNDFGRADRKYRRAVNFVGGDVVNVNKLDLEKESMTDDGSGVHDFAPDEVDKYLTYPEVMLGLTN
ncbi:hypothetical protein BKA70DRAFT_1571536 [Coprinopsis sp. MPI-PUGE-AT-0042]|nr:hypothetical protein BKA70DRAFT_1571536 [Coprinopsis sp. MPI-PUGE-AT-0042]